MTNKPNDVRVSRELLERVCKADASMGASAIHLMDGWVAMGELRAILAQPADQQGEQIQLSKDVREYLQEGIENATGCEESDVDYDFANELAVLLGPLYRHAQPATANVVLPERLDLPYRDEFENADQHAAALGEAKTWNACLDEVAKLNTPQ